MQVEISGQTPETFLVTVDSQVFDIASLLIVNEHNLEEEVRSCAAYEHFWAQVTLDAQKAFEEFERVQYAQYQAHVEKYARYYLKGLGEKTLTEKAKEKTAILIFSKPADNRGHDDQIAYRGYAEECQRVGVEPLTVEQFREEMYMYEGTYEDAEATFLGLKYKSEKLRAISSAFNSKSFNIKSRAADRRAMIGSNI